MLLVLTITQAFGISTLVMVRLDYCNALLCGAREDVIRQYSSYNGLHPPTINNMYIKNSDIHNHNTRHKNYLHVSMAHSVLYAKSFYCSSILIWNEIMNKIEVSISFPQFKIVLKQYLLVNNLKT